MPSDTRQANTTQPEPSPPTDPPPAPTPWRPLTDAAGGEWVEYETHERNQLRYEVINVSVAAVSTKVTVKQDGRSWGDPAVRHDDLELEPLAHDARREGFSRRTEACTVHVAGRPWEATLYEDRWIDEQIPYLRRTWVSRQIPFLGILKMELRGDGQLEAGMVMVDYGPRLP